MKKRLKKSLAIFLAVLMVITAVPFASFLSGVEASAASTATYDKEYYYTEGTSFISKEMAVSLPNKKWYGVVSGSAENKLKNNGYTMFNQDLNNGAGGEYIYFGYKKTTDASKAVRMIGCYNGSNPPTSYVVNVNGHNCTFYPVPGFALNSDTLSSTPIDLNQGADGDYIYLYYTTDPNAGPPLTDIDYEGDSSTNDSASVCQTPVKWLNTNAGGVAGQAADLNRNAGGDDVHFFVHSSITNEVDTAALHNAINAADAKISASGNYVATTVEVLKSERNSGNTIVSDYNADGLSSNYNQTAINNATNSINNAINGLQTTVTLNANGGSIGTSSFDVVVGSATTFNANVSSYVPTRTGYTFKGWATSSTATSGSTSTVSVGLKPTLYAVWEANTYSIIFDNLLDFRKWNTTSASNATISNVGDGGFTLTSDEGAGEGTSQSPLFPVTAGKQYKVDIDFVGDGWDVYIFFYGEGTTSGTGIEFADSTSRFSSNGSGNQDAIFTAPAGAVNAVIRVDANGSNNSVTFKNIRVYEVGKVEDGNASYLLSQDIVFGNAPGSLPTPTREHYDFLGWYTADGALVDPSVPMNILSDISLYSKWAPKKYTVTWIMNSGSEYPVEYTYGDTLIVRSNTRVTADDTKHYTYSWNTTPAQIVTGNVTYTEVAIGEEHTFIDGAYFAPTCTEKGSQWESCTVCSHAKQTEIPALGHKYDAVVTDPTCTTKGFTTHTCSACGDEYVDNYVDALGHTAGEEVIENNVDPDCENTGKYDTVVYCTVCDAELSRKTTTVDALGHKYNKETTAPTCVDKGFTTYTCSVCDDEYVDDYVDALGHKEETITVDATCTADGSITVKCKVCGEVISEEKIPATGHAMGDWEVTEYPTFDAEGEKVKSCANCDYEETEVLKPVKLRTTRIISSEIEGNTISIVGYTNADSIGFYRTTAAGEDIIFDKYYDEEDLADELTPIKYGDNSPRWIIYNSRWAQYAVDGKYTDKMTIAGVEYNFEVVMNSRDLEENDVVLNEKFTNVEVDNENKVITLIPPKGTESVTLKQTSREYDEFTYTIDADSYDNVTLNEVSGAYRGSYTISANGEFETEITVTVNKGKYCEEDYTLKVIFIDFDLINELKPLRGTVSLETYKDGREYLKVTMADGQSSTGIYKTGKGTAVTDVKVELADGTMTEKDNLYVGYVKSNKANPAGEVTISLSNGSVLTYDIVFDMGIVKSEIDPLSELRLVRSTASFDADGTLRITRNAGLAQSAGSGLYATTTAGETVTFTTEQGTVYAGRTDAFIAYLTQNTSNVKGTISYTLSDGTEVSCKAVIDLGLGDEYVEPEEPAYDIAKDLRAIRGTVSVEDNTVTINVAEGKTMTGIYNTTNSGATVEITTENGVFADRTDAYVAYKISNTANVEGTMVVTLADGTIQEYTVIFDLGI